MDDTQTIGEFISPFWMFPRAVFLHTGIGFKGWLQEKLRLLPAYTSVEQSHR